VSATEWRQNRRNDLLEAMPCGVVVIDRSLTVVDANRAFSDLFGEVVGKSCFEATRARSTPCPDCAAEKTFDDGKRRARELSGTDGSGRAVHYLMQFTPIRDAEGQVPFVAATTTDLTSTRRLQREYQTLFEQVPCYVTVINQDYRVVKANEMFRRVFGPPTGEHCYELLKHRQSRCAECPAEKTFADGDTHTSRHVGISREGTATHYAVSTAPLVRSDGETTHVIEMALDMTAAHHLEEELGRANALREVLFEHAPYGILVLDEDKRVVLANRAAESLWDTPRSHLIGRKLPRRAVPFSLDRLLHGDETQVELHDTEVVTAAGVSVAARIAALRLPRGDDMIGAAVIAQDLSEIKQLEREKLDAERLAAVGQTVAGLAHGIKNILTGLEGGMYVTSTGLTKGDEARVRKGWGMLERNISRVSSLVKNLLAFSRGESAMPVITSPSRIVTEVAELFRESAEQHGVTLATEVAEVAPASMDPDGIHTCLTNLISNALDACLVSHNPDCRIDVRLHEDEGVIVFEVADSGCGMDYEVKQKAFTSFFTTKGSGGTGLGLLLTRKIVQQHGGSVTFTSSTDHGTVFRLTFPRQRLPRPTVETSGDEE